MNELRKYVFEFDQFRIDPVKRRLLRDGAPVLLTPKTFDTLIALVQNSGRVLGKDELLKTVWPDTVVEENNLTQNISALRKVFNDSPNEHRYIATIPGRGYRFVADVKQLAFDRLELSPADESTPVEPQPVRQSLAVLPFKVLGKEDADEYLRVGLADALITRLSNLEQITVRPTSAVLKYDLCPKDPVAIGRELGVHSVIEGSLRRVGDRIRVTVQMVCTSAGASWWADKFDEQFTNIFAVEDSISEQVVQALMLKLSSEEETQLSKRYTNSTLAFQAYLMGRYFWSKRTRNGFEKGIEYFEQAIRYDPDYALAYVGLADCNTLLGEYGLIPPGEAFPRAEAAVRRALHLDDKLAEAHASLGALRAACWDWTGAEFQFKRAIQLNPNYPTVRQWYAEFLTAMRRFEEAFEQINHVLTVDPLCLTNKTCEAWIFFHTRRYAEALTRIQSVIAMDPEFAPARLCSAAIYEQLGRYPEALDELKRVQNCSGLVCGYMSCRISVGYTYALAGQPDEARRLLAKLQTLAATQYVQPTDFAMIHAGLGEADQMFHWLNQAYEKQAEWFYWLQVDPRMDRYRSDPRFSDLLERLDLM
ncbi:MAG: winged helix-turn-helix domain-containing protein [Blastocatellia bacterium]|nr:winged helix-turn-helix domain-containing protein [Blastocatellia bacterium]